MPISDRAAIIAGLNDGFRFDPNLQTVTVKQVDADTGATLASAAGVKAVWRDRRRDEVPTEAGGTARIERIRWRLQALNSAAGVVTDVIGFTPDKRDQVVDAAGVAWTIESVRTIGMGARHVAECVRVITG